MLFLNDAKYIHQQLSLVSLFLYILRRSQVAHRASDMESCWGKLCQNLALISVKILLHC